MGRPSNWENEVAKRSPMRSPGHPGHHRGKEPEFRREVSTRKLPRDAADAVGVAQAVRLQWFRRVGGMTPHSWRSPSGRYLSLAEREEIVILNALGKGVREIAPKSAGAGQRSPESCAATRQPGAASSTAEPRSLSRRRNCMPTDPRPESSRRTRNCRESVEEWLSGQIRMPTGTVSHPQRHLECV